MRVTNAFKAFFRMEAAGGIVLMFAGLLAMLAANSPMQEAYEGFLHHYVTVGAGAFTLNESLHFWINDALMAIFFLLVGMEIKRELVAGELSTPAQATLPALAAIGGVACPALIYVYFNLHDDMALRGWAIPTATDIAFSLGVLSLCGSRVPFSLKIFLMAIAVYDDLAAILIIALFYSGALSLAALGYAAVCVAVLFLLNRAGIKSLWPYLLIGVFLWLAVLASGIHATIAGVTLGLFIPLRGEGEGDASPLKRLVKVLHPWVTFGILPLFAFANAGVPLEGITMDTLREPLTMGIALGLILGKPIGIFTVTWMCIRLRIAPMLQDANWPQIFGVGLVAGIGFTMSLFIGTLAFSDATLGIYTRLGVLSGSICSAVLGFAVLRMSFQKAT